MSIKALVFDVFGTLVDWRTSVAREAQAALSPLGVVLDWHAFADAWRDQYQPAMEEVRSGRLPFSKLDALHRRNLDVVLDRFALRQVDEPTRVDLNLAWHVPMSRGRARASATQAPASTWRRRVCSIWPIGSQRAQNEQGSACN